jgi:hypothetical protein
MGGTIATGAALVKANLGEFPGCTLKNTRLPAKIAIALSLNIPARSAKMEKGLIPAIVRPIMTALQMIELRNRTPFEPFEIHLTDGARIRVEHPYEIATRPKARACIIYDQDEKMRIVAYRNITEIVTKEIAG